MKIACWTHDRMQAEGYLFKQLCYAVGDKELNSQAVAMGDAWLESPISQSEPTQGQSGPQRMESNTRERSGKDPSPIPRQGEEEFDLSGGSGALLSRGLSEPRAGSAASGDRPLRRMTEAERLLTLWAGDK